MMIEKLINVLTACASTCLRTWGMKARVKTAVWSGSLIGYVAGFLTGYALLGFVDTNWYWSKILVSLLLAVMFICWIYSRFDKLPPDEFWLQATSELFRRSDAVFALTGYQNSEGSVADINLASFVGIPIFLESEFSKLINWLKERHVGKITD